jgi:flagellar biosynthesis/type III secretory pathway protein FliH
MDIIDKLVNKYLKQYFWCEDFDKLNAVKNADSLSEEERIWYENTLRRYRDTIMSLESSIKQGYAEGYAKGYAKGFAEGYAQECAKTHARMIKIARSLKSVGVSIDDIKRYSYLTEEEIIAL